MNINPNISLVSLILTLGFGCVSHPEENTEGNGVAEEYRTELNEGYYTIIQLDSAYLHSLFRQFEDTHEIATLLPEEIPKLEEILVDVMTKKIQTQQEEYCDLVERFPSVGYNKSTYVMNLYDYGRQYSATYNSKGEKIVYVRCHCGIIGTEKPPQDDGDDQYHKVYDGGICYFRLYVNLDTGSICCYNVNGRA